MNTNAISDDSETSFFEATRASDQLPLALPFKVNHNHVKDRTKVGECINHSYITSSWILLSVESHQLRVTYKKTFSILLMDNTNSAVQWRDSECS